MGASIVGEARVGEGRAAEAEIQNPARDPDLSGIVPTTGMKRGEIESLSETAILRLERELASALRRRSPQENKLAGALRALAPHSPSARDLLAEAAATLAERSAFDRDLFRAALRDLVESEDARALPLLERALAQAGEGGPGVATALSMSCFVPASQLGGHLERIAKSPRTHLSFAAELARVIRGESNGKRLANVAPKLKESYRIAVASDALLPLVHARTELPRALVSGLALLRDAERHLGRWLILAELGARAGDERPLLEARERAIDAPASARLAWALVVWALDPDEPSPSGRPTINLMARLSDRPTSERDMSFVFRLARARVRVIEPLLSSLAPEAKPLDDEVAVRAAMALARADEGCGPRDALRKTAIGGREELRALAAAALWDLGEEESAHRAAESLGSPRLLASMAWSSLVLAAAEGKLEEERILTESNFRRLERGWLEV